MYKYQIHILRFVDLRSDDMALDEATGKRVKVDIEVPKWDQGTYVGRATHFFTTTNPLNLFATPSQLDKAKDTVTKYRKVLILGKRNTINEKKSFILPTLVEFNASTLQL